MVGPSVVLFDGECNMCNAAVQFCLDRERGSALRFAALQSKAAADLLDGLVGVERSCALRGPDGARENGPGSVVLVEGERVATQSTAALRLCTYLRAPWRWLAILRLVPRPIRDAVYRFVGRNRYRWFGKTASCRVPTPELASRFLG
jgi:predicted DCC family thiol-disulfide oxidoreductase YuxK